MQKFAIHIIVLLSIFIPLFQFNIPQNFTAIQIGTLNQFDNHSSLLESFNSDNNEALLNCWGTGDVSISLSENICETSLTTDGYKLLLVKYLLCRNEPSAQLILVKRLGIKQISKGNDKLSYIVTPNQAVIKHKNDIFTVVFDKVEKDDGIMSVSVHLDGKGILLAGNFSNSNVDCNWWMKLGKEEQKILLGIFLFIGIIAVILVAYTLDTIRKKYFKSKKNKISHLKLNKISDFSTEQPIN